MGYVTDLASSIGVVEPALRLIITVYAGKLFLDCLFVECSVAKSSIPTNLMLIGECPNFLVTIVPKALKRRLCALIVAPIEY